MVKQDWFVKAVNFDQPIDLFLVIGHNIARPSTPGSTFGLVHDAIRAVHADTPIQIFGWCIVLEDYDSKLPRLISPQAAIAISEISQL